MITKTLVCRMRRLEQANPTNRTFLYIRSWKAAESSEFRRL